MPFFVVIPNSDPNAEVLIDASYLSCVGISQISFSDNGLRLVVGLNDGSVVKVDANTLELRDIVIPSPWKWKWKSREPVPLLPDPRWQDPTSTLRIDMSSMKDVYVAVNNSVTSWPKAVGPREWRGLDVIERGSGVEVRLCVNGSLVWREDNVVGCDVKGDRVFTVSQAEERISVSCIRCRDGLGIAKWRINGTQGFKNTPTVAVARLPDVGEWLLAMTVGREIGFYRVNENKPGIVDRCGSAEVPHDAELTGEIGTIGTSGILFECRRGFVLLEYGILENGVRWIGTTNDIDKL